jgi:signal transduction histidine kinase
VALCIPLGYFVLRTYWSLEQEEIAELRYFGVTLFDRMEEELASVVRNEERRAVDQYNYYHVPPHQAPGSKDTSRSPLSELPKEKYILGYFQNNPDGSFQTPLIEDEKRIPPDRSAVVALLNEVNRTFNLKRKRAPESFEAQPLELHAKTEREQVSSFAERYLDPNKSRAKRSYLGQEKKRVEQLTPRQALKLAKRDQQKVPSKERQEAAGELDADVSAEGSSQIARQPVEDEVQLGERENHHFGRASTEPVAVATDALDLRVEVDPMQSVFIDNTMVYVFRRIVINDQIYRQGFVIKVKEFLDDLVDTHFVKQPMAGFTRLSLRVVDRGRQTAIVQAGAATQNAKFELDRTFPRPFAFLRATLTSDQIPKSVGRRTLNIMMVVLVAIILMGLLAIYRSARTVVELSERRSGFVSSVTHELKTPLTNIRMYIEMLEQGIARDHEREQEYFRILGSESARLSRLINNVLEYSKLEKRQRHVDWEEGTFEEVIQEVKDVMQEKLRQEEFALEVERQEIRPFRYDREAMIQILINLIDNSMKFGKGFPARKITLRIGTEDKRIRISVADTGPGIPRHALKKVFDDFYRVDSELTRATGGTGIGLALVNRLVAAMGGSITVKNNEGPGCTFTIKLPMS